jgi:hypothetical protein
MMFASEIGPRDRDAQHHRSGIFDQLFSLLLNAGQDAVDQDHATVRFIDTVFIRQESPQRKPLPVSRSHHGGDLDKEAFTTQTALEIRRPGLRFRQESHSSADANELRSQLQFRQSRFAHTIIIVSDATDETGKTEMARLISAVLSQRRPSIL